MEIKEDLFKLIVNDFGSLLSQYEYNQYVIKLRDYFLPYIELNKLHCRNIEELFKYELTRIDIINSTIHYVENNPNVMYKSAVDDFLIALNRLFEKTVNKKYFNQNLVNIQPFNPLSTEIEHEIEKRGVKHLKDRESFPSISEKEYDLLVDYLKNMKCDKITDYQYKIITSLLLLYGFSFDKIININYEDYSIERGILSMFYDADNRYIALEIPYNLKLLMNKFIDIRKNIKTECKSMFITTKGNKIKHGYLSDFFKKVKNVQHIKEGISRNSFTPTGLAKYAVINMILEGMNQSIILDLTGFKLDHYLDCQNKVNEIKNLNLNRYVNRTIRGIGTFDDINNC
ncbi:hypothetical protein FDA52_10840 [Clostridium botulinum]|nr:hypothetical protein [Clostridium botulinum]